MALVLVVAVVCCGLLLASSPAQGSPVGANVGSASYWSNQGVFCDLVKSSEYPFGSPRSPYDHSRNCSAVSCDDRGWPLGDYGIWIWSFNSILDEGLFTVRAQGNASVTTWNYPVINQHYDPATNTFSAQINVSFAHTKFVSGSASGPDQREPMLDLRINNVSTPATGFVNVSVRSPACADSDIFHPAYIRLLKQFSGPLRFMSALDATASGQTEWATRALVSAPTWTNNAQVPCSPSGAGAGSCHEGELPWEVVVALANAAGRDPWINIPPNATVAYAVALAELLQASLDPSLNVYVEWANEASQRCQVWNWMFPVAKWNLGEAVDEVQSKGDPFKLDYDKCGNKYYWAYRRVVAKLAVEFLPAMRKVFGAQASRLRGVYASQIGSSDGGAGNAHGGPAATALTYFRDVHGLPGDHFYALAGAPYYGLGEMTHWSNLTEAMVLERSKEVIAQLVPSAANNFTQTPVVGYAALARMHGLRLVGYEGGPDYAGDIVQPGANRSLPQSNIDAKMAARMSPETATLLSTYLLGLQQGGMEMLCFFGAFIGSFNSTIVYSVLQDIYDDQTQSALVQGIAASVQAPVPSITAGHVLRATWTPTDMVKGALWGLPTGPCADCGAAGPCFRCLHANATMAFAINTAPGSVTLSVLVSSQGDGPSLAVSVNGASAGAIAIRNTTRSGSVFEPQGALDIHFPAADRLQVLEFAVGAGGSGDWAIAGLRFANAD